MVINLQLIKSDYLYKENFKMNIFSVPFPDIFLGGGGGEKLDNADSKGRNNSKLNFTQVSNHERKLEMKRFSRKRDTFLLLVSNFDEKKTYPPT